jgi:hypothetical protein
MTASMRCCRTPVRSSVVYSNSRAVQLFCAARAGRRRAPQDHQPTCRRNPLSERERIGGRSSSGRACRPDGEEAVRRSISFDRSRLVGAPRCPGVRHPIRDFSITIRHLLNSDPIVDGTEKINFQVVIPHGVKRMLWKDTYIDPGLRHRNSYITSVPEKRRSYWFSVASTTVEF